MVHCARLTSCAERVKSFLDENLQKVLDISPTLCYIYLRVPTKGGAMQKPGGRTAATYSGPDFSVYPGEQIKDSPSAFFEGILPEVQRRAEIVFRFCDAEQRQEQVQEVLCVAWKDMLRCLKNRKRFTPATLTYYAILHVRSGNFFRGLHVQDAMSEATRIRGRSVIEGLTEGLIDCKVKLPSEQVRVKLDYGGFFREAGLTRQEKRTFALTAKGYRPKEIAGRLNVSKPRISHIKARLEDKLIRYFGEDIRPE